MKEYQDVKIVGIDNGYGNIKTANCCFPAGLTIHDTEPVFKDELLIFDGLLVNCINHFRNDCLREGKPTEDVEDLLLKAIDAPPLKVPLRNWRLRGVRCRDGASEYSANAEAKNTKSTAARRWFEREDR